MRPGVAPVILPGLVRRVSCQDIGIPLAGSTSRRWSAASRVENAVPLSALVEPAVVDDLFDVPALVDGAALA